MRTIELAGHRVELYEAIDELPMSRLHRFNKMLLIDAGVGSSMSDVDTHIERVTRYLSLGKTTEAQTELSNMRQNIYMVLSGINTRHLAFAALVRSVDDVARDDISDAGLRATLEIFADVPVCELTDVVRSAKKKIDDELHAYFPSMFDDASAKEYHNLLRKRTAEILDGILGDDMESREGTIEHLTTLLITYGRPQCFEGGAAEVQYDRQYEDMCILMSQRLNADPKQYTVMEYYTAVEYIEHETKEMKKIQAKTKR